MAFIIISLLCSLVIGFCVAYYLNRRKKQKEKAGIGAINFVMYTLLYMAISYAFMVLLYTLFFLMSSFK